MKNTTTLIGLTLLMASFAFHNHYGFIAWHLFRALALLGHWH